MGTEFIARLSHYEGWGMRVVEVATTQSIAAVHGDYGDGKLSQNVGGIVWRKDSELIPDCAK